MSSLNFRLQIIWFWNAVFILLETRTLLYLLPMTLCMIYAYHFVGLHTHSRLTSAGLILCVAAWGKRQSSTLKCSKKKKKWKIFWLDISRRSPHYINWGYINWEKKNTLKQSRKYHETARGLSSSSSSACVCTTCWEGKRIERTVK